MSLKKILGSIQQADRDYNLISDGDRIAVGLSGGKDSNLLLYALNCYRKIAKKKLRKHFEVIGIHIDLGFGEEDMQPLYDLFKAEDVEIVVVKSKIAQILDLYKHNDRIQCSRCSQLKKGAVVKTAKDNGCNKIAYGHHGDDAIETLLMNQIYGAKLATFEPSCFLSRQAITLIRPFCLCWEKDIKNCGLSLGLPALKSGCPMDGYTKRQTMKDLLKDLEKQFPDIKKNMLHSIYNTKQMKLWQPIEYKDDDK